jgi:hypothetical protein
MATLESNWPVADWQRPGSTVDRAESRAKPLAAFCIRASFSQERLRYDAPSATVVYKGKDGSRQKTFERSFGPMCRGLPENRQKRV